MQETSNTLHRHRSAANEQQIILNQPERPGFHVEIGCSSARLSSVFRPLSFAISAFQISAFQIFLGNHENDR